MRDEILKDYLGEYNELLSKASLEHNGSFAVLASPTLNKQETATFLYEDVIKYINSPNDLLKNENPFILRLKFIARIGVVLVHLVRDSMRFRVLSLPKNFIYIRTWLVSRSFINGVIKDDYFRQLIDDLECEHNVIVGFQPLGYGKLLKEFNKAKKPSNYIIPLGLLGPLDIITVLFKYITTAKIKLKNKYIFKGNNITKIINHSLELDYYKFRSFQAYLDLFIAKKLEKYKPKILLYIFENQAWEKSYLTVFKNTPTKTFGYQSSGFSFRYLNFFPSSLDKKIMLFPDAILTVGNIFTKTLKKYGHFPVPLKTFGSTRFNYKSNGGAFIVKKQNHKILNRVLYAFSVLEYQYEKIIIDLSEAFGNSSICVDLKFHPLYPTKYLLKRFKIIPKNFKIISDVDITKITNLYDVVLFNDNSFGLESLINGVISFEYQTTETVDETRMFNFNSYKSSLKNNDLMNLAKKLKTNTFNKIFDFNQITNYINEVYKPYNKDNLIIQYLDDFREYSSNIFKSSNGGYEYELFK